MRYWAVHKVLGCDSEHLDAWAHPALQGRVSISHLTLHPSEQDSDQATNKFRL